MDQGRHSRLQGQGGVHRRDYLTDYLTGKGLYTGETMQVLHMAILNGDVKFVRYLLANGANINAKAVGEYFMPLVQRRGVDFRAWDSCFRFLNIHDVDDRVGDANTESGFADPDLYFGQLPLSFAACTGQVEICDELKKVFVNQILISDPTGIHATKC